MHSGFRRLGNRRRRRGLRFGLRRFCASSGQPFRAFAIFKDICDNFSYRSFFVLMIQNIGQNSTLGGLNLAGDLIGLHFNHRLPFFNSVAFFFQPGDNRDYFLVHIHFGHNKLCGHCCSSRQYWFAKIARTSASISAS